MKGNSLLELAEQLKPVSRFNGKIRGTITSFGSSGNATSVFLDGKPVAATMFARAYKNFKEGDYVEIMRTQSNYPLPDMNSITKVKL